MKAKVVIFGIEVPIGIGRCLNESIGMGIGLSVKSFHRSTPRLDRFKFFFIFCAQHYVFM